VLGNLFKLAGFDYTASSGVLAELQQNLAPSARLKARRFATVPTVKGLQRITEVSMYSIDPLVRRAAALQTTRDNTGPVARMHPREAQKHDVGGSARLRVIAGGESVTLDFLIDRRIPEGCVLIPAGCPETRRSRARRCTWRPGNDGVLAESLSSVRRGGSAAA
jgi:NADH-quinone oxidoreductase subunit G